MKKLKTILALYALVSIFNTTKPIATTTATCLKNIAQAISRSQSTLFVKTLRLICRPYSARYFTRESERKIQYAAGDCKYLGYQKESLVNQIRQERQGTVYILTTLESIPKVFLAGLGARAMYKKGIQPAPPTKPIDRFENPFS